MTVRSSGVRRLRLLTSTCADSDGKRSTQPSATPSASTYPAGEGNSSHQSAGAARFRVASDLKGKSLNKSATNIVQSADHITAVGTAVVRYGLVVVITWIGLMKFTGSEAMRIQVFISHSPFM